AVLKLEEAGCIEHRGGVIFRERLLGGSEQPNSAVAKLSQVFGKSVKIENKIGFGRNILTDFVHDKEHILLAGLTTHQVDHLLGTSELTFVDVEGKILEVLSLGEQLGIKFCR